MSKLWRVNITVEHDFDVVALGDTKEEAEENARVALDEDWWEDNGHTFVGYPSLIESEDDMPKGWLDIEPYGDHNNMTCRTILLATGNEDKDEPYLSNDPRQQWLLDMKPKK